MGELPVSHVAGADAIGTADPADPTPKPADTPSRPIDWWRVTGEDRLAAWHGLAEFVDAFVARYNLQLELRPCWWRHADAVEELTALWHVRQSCFGEDATLTSAGTWLDNMYKSRDRLRLIFVSCRQTHVDTSVHSWMTDEARATFAAAVRRDSGLD